MAQTSWFNFARCNIGQDDNGAPVLEIYETHNQTDTGNFDVTVTRTSINSQSLEIKKPDSTPPSGFFIAYLSLCFQFLLITENC